MIKLKKKIYKYHDTEFTEQINYTRGKMNQKELKFGQIGR